MSQDKTAKDARRTVRLEFRLKIAAGAILLASFITQNHFYDKWNTQSQRSESAAVHQSLIDKSVLLNEALFFTTGAARDTLQPNQLEELRRQYIREAARKSALAKSVWILASDLDNTQKLDLSNGMMARANGVKDLSSFWDFNGSINELDKTYANIIDLQIEASEQRRKTARFIYLGLYVIGAGLFLFSLVVERRRILAEVK
ncbi:MAG: hypothetical protein QOD75_3538 [Blastocatellia bacterium]|jgi:hypothetical protein|nr:hypothetical protein [Blastocatellia bacterium]